jgi:hypothetical protein
MAVLVTAIYVFAVASWMAGTEAGHDGLVVHKTGVPVHATGSSSVGEPRAMCRNTSSKLVRP